MMKRSCGILMHITSLPSPYGIGTLGREAYRFADFLQQSGQTYWQVLPINPTGFADSPYQAFSTYAGNPYLIDLDMLCEQGLLDKSDYAQLDWGDDPTQVDYGKVWHSRFDVLRNAAKRADRIELSAYEAFCKENDWWLDDYAAYMAIKQHYENREWTLWPDTDLRDYAEYAVKAFCAEHTEEIFFWKFVQYLFFDQWYKLRAYANDIGIRLIGDIPIYVSADSADVWSRRRNFCFEDGYIQKWYAGVPPDYFSEDGQLWGNPVYDWGYLKETEYAWWLDRLCFLEQMFNMLRIDHFRGFESFYVVERGEKTARNGKWIKGPGGEFFDIIQDHLPEFPIIAEDLGFLTEEVHHLRRTTGYPGMKILEFAFDDRESSDYLPHKYEYNCVAYTGTHDNTTLSGWLETATDEVVGYARAYGALTNEEGYAWGLIRILYSSVANIAIAQMQDFLGLGDDARMNLPSTVGGNWSWRMLPDYARPELMKKLKGMVELYGR